MLPNDLIVTFEGHHSLNIDNLWQVQNYGFAGHFWPEQYSESQLVDNKKITSDCVKNAFDCKLSSPVYCFIFCCIPVYTRKWNSLCVAYYSTHLHHTFGVISFMFYFKFLSKCCSWLQKTVASCILEECFPVEQYFHVCNILKNHYYNTAIPYK